MDLYSSRYTCGILSGSQVGMATRISTSFSPVAHLKG